MSLEKGIQRIGSVYIYAWIISLAFVFFWMFRRYNNGVVSWNTSSEHE